MAVLGINWQEITHVAITHFHGDHFGDLPQLVMAWRWGQLPPRSEPVTIYGPPGFGAFMEKLADVHGTWLLNPGFPLTVREVHPDELVRIVSGPEIAALPVPHTTASVAYSIRSDGKRLVYTGDTGFDETLGTWASGCDLMLAECSLPESMAVKEHLTPSEAGRIAFTAGAKQLVLTHFYPPVEAVDIRQEVARHYAGEVTLATDGWSTEI